MNRYAMQNNLKHCRKRKLKNDIKARKSEIICKDDYVILKNPFNNEKQNNLKYGWVVMKVLENYEKRKYVIKNVLNNEELVVNKGRIAKFYQPPFTDPSYTLESEQTRLVTASQQEAQARNNGQ